MTERESASNTPFVSRAVPANAAALRELLREASSSFDVDAELARPYARVWLTRSSRDDEAATGVLLAWQVFDELEIIDLYVAPSARRKGVGRALMSTLLRYGKEHALSVALLEVRRDNHAAQGLYFSFGFEQVGERRAYYPDGEDALLLSLRLSSV
jgi:ribosomal-protein-alanine N-acetyltransferase